ncbi:hypothetical protein K2Q08_03340 [Patescibacteria group bacterium]|nr:hypothetical protein [Patescibacteria group bacterium]
MLAANATPDAPTNLGPTELVNGSATTTTQPQFSFTLSDPDVGDSLRYQIQVDDTSDFSSPVVDYIFVAQPQGTLTFNVGKSGGSGAQYIVGNTNQTLSDGSYYWRVRAGDTSFATSTYSVANSGAVAFVVNTAPQNQQSNNTTSVGGGTLPWCSGPMAPGWNVSLPGGGCGARRGLLPDQIRSILTLLSVFGANPSVIAKVSVALGQ